MRPVVAIYATFLQRSYDQIVHDVATQNLPVTFCIDRGGLVAEDGTTHHGAFDVAYLRHVPNMVVMAPKDENELQHMIKTAVSHDGPASVRYPRGVSLGVPMDAEPAPLPIGKAEVVWGGQEPADVVIAAFGVTVWPAVHAAERLAKEGLSVAVINGRFAKPLDTTLIGEMARRARCLITVEEGTRLGGFGSGVVEALSELGIVLPSKILGLPDWYIEQGPQDLLRERYGLTAEGIYQSTKQFVSRIQSGTVDAEQPHADRYTLSTRGRQQSIGDDQGS
jgi:1-deoxy-D-xylulose-5-phosphate synthase